MYKNVYKRKTEERKREGGKKGRREEKGRKKGRGREEDIYRCPGRPKEVGFHGVTGSYRLPNVGAGN